MYFIVCEGRKAGTQGNKNEKISYFVSNTSLSTYTHPSFQQTRQLNPNKFQLLIGLLAMEGRDGGKKHKTQIKFIILRFCW